MSNMFKTELYPMIEKGIARPEAQKKIKHDVGKYVDVHSSKLTTQGPSQRPSFSDADKARLYDACNVTKEQVTAIIRKNPMIKGQWRIMNDPFNSAIALAIRYCAINKKDDLLNSLTLYLTLSMYPSLHYKYFKFEPNEQIMAYTIANMSNKFKIRQVNTLLEALLETSVKCYDHHKDNIIKGDDKNIVDFVMDIKTRLNSLLKNISSEFYRNWKEGNYLNADGDSYEEDNYYEADSNSYAVERITNNVTMKLITNGPDTATISMSAKWCQVSNNELRNYINTLVVSENREEIRTIIESILTDYLITSQHNADDVIRNNKFLAYSVATYKKSNTTDKNILKIKEILDKWMVDVDIYKKTQRQATINDFRRAIYLFIVITIMKNA